MIKMINLGESILRLGKEVGLSYWNFMIKNTLAVFVISIILLISINIALFNSLNVIAFILLIPLAVIVIYWMYIFSPIATGLIKLSEDVKIFDRWTKIIRGMVVAFLLISLAIIILPIGDNPKATLALFLIIIALCIIPRLRR